MKKTISFYQHIFSSSRSRGGYLPFQYSANLTDIQKEDAQVFGKVEYDTLLYLKLALEGDQLFHINTNGLNIYGKSRYLGNDIHSNSNRPGNYISHVLLSKEQNHFNPITLFENFDWKNQIKPEEDTSSNPIHINEGKFNLSETLALPNIESYFEFLQDIRLESFAKVLDLLVAGFIYRDREKLNKIIVVDKSEYLKNWAYGILLCLPDNLAHDLNFVTLLKNQVLPQMCNLIFTESIDLIPARVAKEAFLLNVNTSTINGYSGQSMFAKKIIEHIKNGRIKEWLEILQEYNKDLTIDRFNNTLNKGANFYNFLENVNSINDNSFYDFLQNQFQGVSDLTQKNTLTQRIFDGLQMNQDRYDLSLKLLLEVIRLEPNSENIFDVCRKYFKNNESFIEISFYNFIKKITEDYFKNPKELFRLLEFVHDEFKNENLVIIEIEKQVANKLFSDDYKLFWLSDDNLINSIEDSFKYLIEIDSDIKKHYYFWKSIKSNFENIKREPIQWDSILEVLKNLDYFDSHKYLLIRKVKESIPVITLDTFFDSKYTQKAENAYKLLNEKGLIDDFYPKIKWKEIEIAKEILDKNKSNDEKMKVIHQLEPSLLESLQSAVIISENQHLSNLFIRVRIKNIDSLVNELNNEQKHAIKDKELISFFLTNNIDEINLKNSRILLNNCVTDDYWKNKLDDGAVQVIVDKVYEGIYLKEGLSKADFESLNKDFEKLLNQRPKIKNNPVIQLRESKESLLSISNIKEFDIQCRKIIKRHQLSEAIINMILDKTVRIGWSNLYWSLLLKILKEYKVKDSIYINIIDWLISYKKEIPEKQYLLVELIIASIESKDESMLKCLTENKQNSLEITESQYNTIKFLLENRINTEDTFFSYFLQHFAPKKGFLDFQVFKSKL